MSIRKIIIVLLSTCGLYAQVDQISISINDLPRLLEQSSPQIRIIRSIVELNKSERDTDLQWSNPGLEFAYERVQSGGNHEIEQEILLHKSIDLPWNYWRATNAWKSEINANQLNSQQYINELLVAVRYDYIRLSLLNSLLALYPLKLLLLASS